LKPLITRTVAPATNGDNTPVSKVEWKKGEPNISTSL
jgi:hypothetical protein